MADRLGLHEGVLTVAGGEERYILIPIRAYEAIIDAMVGLVGDAAAGPLYYLGKKIGRGLVEEMERLLSGRRGTRDIVEAYARYLSELGFGRVEILSIQGDEATIRLIAPPSLEAVRIAGASARVVGRGRQRGVCHLERGMLAAVMDAITGRPHVAFETDHGTEPEPYCTIVVKPMMIRAARNPVAATA